MGSVAASHVLGRPPRGRPGWRSSCGGSTCVRLPAGARARRQGAAPAVQHAVPIPPWPMPFTPSWSASSARRACSSRGRPREHRVTRRRRRGHPRRQRGGGRRHHRPVRVRPRALRPVPRLPAAYHTVGFQAHHSTRTSMTATTARRPSRTANAPTSPIGTPTPPDPAVSYAPGRRLRHFQTSLKGMPSVPATRTATSYRSRAPSSSWLLAVTCADRLGPRPAIPEPSAAATRQAPVSMPWPDIRKPLREFTAVSKAPRTTSNNGNPTTAPAKIFRSASSHSATATTTPTGW